MNTYTITLNEITSSNTNKDSGTTCWYAGAKSDYYLEPFNNYSFSIRRTSLPSWCGNNNHNPKIIFASSSCQEYLVNGVETNSYSMNDTLPYQSFMLMVVPSTLIKFEYPRIEGIYSLVADGYSTISPSLSGTSLPNLRFLIVTNSPYTTLGCKIDSLTGVLTAGTEAGTILVRATNNTSGGCYTDERVEIKDCGDCNSGFCGVIGGVQGANSSVDVKIGLGWSSVAGNAGFLSIKQDAPSTALYTPATLRYNYRRDKSEVDVVMDAQYVIQQIKVPEGLANVVTNATNSYSIQLYSAANVLTKTNGSYPLTNSPFSTITITNLSFSTNRFQISKDGEVLYNYNWITNGWEMVTGGSLRQETKTTVTNGTVRTETTVISDGTNPAVYQNTETITNSSGFGDRTLEETFGTGANARTNSYTYTTDGYYQQIMRGDGSWQYFLYDSKNRPTNIFSSFGNQSVTTNKTLCRMVEYTYSTNVISGSGDTFRIDTNTPRRTIEYLLGQEIGRSYTVMLTGERWDIQCVMPGAAWNDASNLVTVTRFFTNGQPYYLNAVKSVLRPDGTITIYQYDNLYQTYKTNIVLTGHPSDSYNTNIDDGIKTISIVGSLGQVLTNTIVDMASGITLSREIYQYDSLNRRTTTTYLDGTSTIATYGCCTLDSETDRDGTVTSYGYDALKRRITTTRNSITISNVYDPAGNILGTVRYGTDASAITLGQTAFNNSGDMIASTNALNSPTVYTNWFDGSGQLVKQTTYADGGTRIKTYYRDGQLQSVIGSAVFPARYEYGVATSGTGTTNAYTKEIKLDASFADTSERTTNFVDLVGRAYKTAYVAASGTPFNISYFNTKGQLTNTVDADGVSLLYSYNPKGEMAYSITDSNRDYTIDYSGNDQIAYVTNDVVNNGTADARRTRTYLWMTDGSNTSNLVSTVETSADGLRSWNTVWNNGSAVTSQTRIAYDAANGYRYVTNIAPDNSYSVAIMRYGTNVSSTAFDSAGSQLGQTTYAYDAHGRPCKSTDARTGTTTNYFNNADQISGMVTPIPATGGTSQVTTNYFDNMGRVWKTTLSDNTSVTNKYDVTGLLTNTFGSRTYPVAYAYDAQGRMKTMKTWKDFTGNSGTATTTWNYDIYRGWLTNKTYDGGAAGPVYTYTAAGRLVTRAWARGTNTTYSYNYAGDLLRVDYSDSTPDVGYGYDRLGRQLTVTNDTTLVCTFAYNNLGQVLSETWSSGPLSGLAITNGFDSLLRRSALGLASQSSTLTQFGYDTASRLATITNGSSTVAYDYLANSPLLNTVTFKQSGTTRLATTNAYDALNRRTQISSTPSADAAVSFNYQQNSANQRVAITNADNSRWVYTYDNLGQVVSGKKYWSDGTPVAGQQFEYTFDDIGNRKTTASGGDQSGANLRTAGFTNNALNQLTSRGVPGYVDIQGSTTNTATVTVNNQPTYRHGDYFRAELTADNSAAALWFGVTNVAVLNNGTNADIVASTTGNVFVAKSPEVFIYDADGNVTNDGRWTFTWDAENRLASMISLTNTPAESKRRLNFGYDYQGRRITKAVESWTGSSWTMTASNKFVYDGWNLLAELNATNNAVIRSYVWGLDLSGSLQGAGGVGGLLMVTDAVNGTHFVAHDGNGNVAALVKASDGTTSANYEYGPFGETLRATGLMASINPFRFSTKYQDNESGLIYYGYRYYSASTGRWLGRDPLEEQGGLHVYGFVGNDPANGVDSDGRVVLKLMGMAQRYVAGRLNAFAGSTSSAFLGGAAAGLASLYETSANIMDPRWSDYLERTLRRYDNAGKIYDKELGPCGKGKIWAGWSAGAYFLGDFFGLNGLPEGIYSVDLATGASLDGWESWSRGLSGAGSTILFAAPAVSQFKFANQPITFGRTATQLEFDFVNGDLSGRLTQFDLATTSASAANTAKFSHYLEDLARLEFSQAAKWKPAVVKNNQLVDELVNHAYDRHPSLAMNAQGVVDTAIYDARARANILSANSKIHSLGGGRYAAFNSGNGEFTIFSWQGGGGLSIGTPTIHTFYIPLRNQMKTGVPFNSDGIVNLRDIRPR